VLAFVLLGEAPNPSGAAREIPVEVVTESAPPEKRPAAPGEATLAPSSKPRQMPETEANPKPANEAMSGPNPVAKPAAPKPSAADNMAEEGSGETSRVATWTNRWLQPGRAAVLPPAVIGR